MPLMLDNAMDANNDLGNGTDAPMQVDPLDVDDLFGEGVNLALPSISKQLYLRIDDLRTRGCCQTIAWSKSGTVASVTPDGKSVQVRFLRTDPADGSWGLSEPTVVDLVTASASCPIVHLAWAGTTSHELAVIDAGGRVAILAFSIALNRPFLTRKWDADHPDDLQAVAGCFWLNLAPQNKNYHVFHGPAVKDGPTYRYESSFLHAFGPWHPNPQKSALLCVTVHGYLRLFWTQNNNRLEESTLELESIISTDELITHASLHSDKNHVYLALATASQQLRAVRVSISWGLPPADQKLPPSGQTLNPTMHARCLAISSWMPSGVPATPTDASMTQISHIELLPSQIDNTGQNWAPIVIIVVRSYLPTPDTSFQEPQSIIDRWELGHEPAPALHPAFEQMGGRRNSSTGPNDKEPNRLKKLDPIVVNKVVIGIQSIQFGKVFCVAFSDGSIEYRDRFTMQETYNEINLDRIMTLNQVGFTFAEQNPCLQVAFSPTNCSIVQVLNDGKIKWNGLRHTSEDIGDSNQDAQYAAVIAALTVAASAATFYHVNIDDILAAARPFVIKKTFTRDWIHEIVRMLKVPVDYSEELHHDTLVRNSSLQLCLSIMNHLGYNGDYQPRSFSGKFATLSLNVRNVVVLITIASNTPTNMREKLSPLDEHEVVDALVSCSNWILDLIAWLSDALFSLMDNPSFKELLQPQHSAQMSKFLQSRSDPALQILLCSSTRGYVSAACRRLSHLEALSHRAIEFYDRRASRQNVSDPNNQGKLPHVLLYKAYRRMQHITQHSIVKIQDFEHLLNTLHDDMRAAYQSAFASVAAQQQQKNNSSNSSNNKNGQQSGGGGPDRKQIESQIKSAQFHAELTMLLTGQPTPPFIYVLSKFFGQDLPAFRTKIDPAQLFFADYSLLEISDEPCVLELWRNDRQHVDVFKRVKVTAPLQERQRKDTRQEDEALPQQQQQQSSKGAQAQWRRCVRCAAVMEDVFGGKPGFTFVLTQQRKCSCGGHWAMLPKGSLVS